MSKLIALAMMLLIVFITISVTILRRKVLVDFGEINFYSLHFWISFFSIPMVWVILVMMGLVFGLNAIVYTFLQAHEGILLTWALAFPSFILTVIMGHIFLGEKIQTTQYPAIALLVLSTIIAMMGAHMYFK